MEPANVQIDCHISCQWYYNEYNFQTTKCVSTLTINPGIWDNFILKTSKQDIKFKSHKIF
jgi:hypothetical protein